MTPCPCCSAKSFAVCCRPYLSGKSTPRTVKQLMRSRYTAYTLGGYGAYLQQTWHPTTVPDIPTASLDATDTQWVGLEVLASNQSGDHGMVEFKAHFLDESGKPRVHHEKSSFVREGGRWLYVDAEIEGVDSLRPT